MEKFTVIKILLLLSLVSIFIVLYVPDVVHKYRAKATTITTKQESIGKELIWPAITFCMQRPFKPSVLKKTFGDIPNRNIFTTNDKDVKYEVEESLEKLYQKATYRKKRNFQGDFDLNWPDKNKEDFIVEELPTEDYGMCYSILHKNKTSDSGDSGIHFGITLDKDLVEEDHPKGVSIFITTENTRYFLINGLWPFKPLIISKKFAPKYLMKAKVEEIEWKYYDGNPDCQRGCKMSQCLKWSNILESKHKCEIHCVPIILSGLYKNVSESMHVRKVSSITRQTCCQMSTTPE